MKMKKMNKKGFTLVEIMIVVAIIGLLAAIGIPSFQKARANSVAKTKLNNLRMVETAAEQYAMENALTDGQTVAVADWDDYIKGGTSALSIGSITAKTPTVTLGTPLTVGDLY